MPRLKSELEVICPCCQSVLVIDLNLGRVVSHSEPERGNKPELSDSGSLPRKLRGVRRSSSSRSTTRRPGATRCRAGSRKR